MGKGADIYGVDITKARPLSDLVLIRRDPPKTQEGAIQLINQQKSWWGTVVATGPGAFNKQGVRLPMEVKAGDRVCVLYGVAHEVDGFSDMIEVSEGQILLIGGDDGRP